MTVSNDGSVSNEKYKNRSNKMFWIILKTLWRDVYAEFALDTCQQMLK